MPKNFAPQTLLALCTVICLLIASATLALALQATWTGVDFSEHPDGFLQAVASSKHSPNADLKLTPVAAFLAGSELIPADSVLLIEEPDVLSDYQQYNQLLMWQHQLADAARQQQLALRTTHGETFALHSAPRPITSLPALFWLQLFFGVGGALTGALVWSTRRSDTAAQLYLLTGLGYLIFAPAAAIYSTRELILDGNLFRLLSVLNHFGALLFTASLTSLLWCYPKPIKSARFIVVIYSAALIIWLVDIAQLATPMVFHFGVLGIFALSFIFAVWQWRRTKNNPVDRAALRWFLLAIYFATGLFAAVIILPAALHLPQPASQGVMFGAFLIMYWGLALGIVRYRLFSLEQWWHAIMAWFLGGVCVILIDVFLIMSLTLPKDIALSLAVALTGWLYFPLRQSLWQKFGYQQAPLISNWLPEVLPLLIGVEHTNQHQAWPHSLERVWRALEVKQVPRALSQAKIIDDGLTLLVPDITSDSDCHYRVHCANNGQRLFNQRDIDSLVSLQKISALAWEITEAKSLGAKQERQRIRRDIHDDMGAKLLTLLHTCPSDLQPLVRELLQATRDLVQALNLHAVDALTASDAWQLEAQQRCDAAGVSMVWEYQADALPAMLSARWHVNLTRILREAVSNALKHGAPKHIVVSWQRHHDYSELTLHDDGCGTPSSAWVEGNGCRIMRQRAEELGGELAWQITDGCRLQLRLPLAEKIL